MTFKLNGITSYTGTIRMPVPYIYSQIGHAAWYGTSKVTQFLAKFNTKNGIFSYRFYFNMTILKNEKA